MELLEEMIPAPYREEDEEVFTGRMQIPKTSPRPRPSKQKAFVVRTFFHTM